MNQCTEIRALLALRCEDRSAAEQAAVEAHLVECAPCRAVQREYAEHERLICTLPRAALEPIQRQALLTRLGLMAPHHRGSIFVGLNLLSALGSALSLLLMLAPSAITAVNATLTPAAAPPIAAPAPRRAQTEAVPTAIWTSYTDTTSPTPYPAPAPPLAGTSL